jgi:hypothetical protein
VLAANLVYEHRERPSDGDGDDADAA